MFYRLVPLYACVIEIHSKISEVVFVQAPGACLYYFSAGPTCFSMLVHPYRVGELCYVRIPCLLCLMDLCELHVPVVVFMHQPQTCSLMATLSECSYLTISYYQIFLLFHHYLCQLLRDSDIFL